MRRGERRRDHRRGRRLAHALDGMRSSRPPRRAPHRRRAATAVGAAVDRPRCDVLAGDRCPCGPLGDGGEVDAEVLGQLAHRRLGERTRARRGGASASSGAGTGGGGRARCRAAWRGGTWSACVRGGVRRTRPRAVADQHGAASARRGAADHAGLDRALGGGISAPRRGVARRPAAASGADAGVRRGAGARRDGSVSTAMIGVPTSTVSPSATSSSVTTPANGRGQLDERLGRLDLDDDVC